MLAAVVFSARREKPSFSCNCEIQKTSFPGQKEAELTLVKRSLTVLQAAGDTVRKRSEYRIGEGHGAVKTANTPSEVSVNYDVVGGGSLAGLS